MSPRWSRCRHRPSGTRVGGRAGEVERARLNIDCAAVGDRSTDGACCSGAHRQRPAADCEAAANRDGAARIERRARPHREIAFNRSCADDRQRQRQLTAFPSGPR
jgi:hypothetical protein